MITIIIIIIIQLVYIMIYFNISAKMWYVVYIKCDNSIIFYFISYPISFLILITYLCSFAYM